MYIHLLSLRALFGSLLIATLTLPLSAAVLYWDTSDVSGIQGGSGTWSTSVVNWNTATNVVGGRGVWNDGDTARFNTGTGTITLATPVTVEGIYIASGSTTYSFSGDSTNFITWTGNGSDGDTNRLRIEGNAGFAFDVPIVFASGSTLQINANNAKNSTVSFNQAISGSGGVSIVFNPINIALNANNTYTGQTSVSRGSMQFNGSNSGLGSFTIAPAGNNLSSILAGTGSIALATGASFTIGGAVNDTRLSYVAPGLTTYHNPTSVNGVPRFNSTLATLSLASDTTAGVDFQNRSRLQIGVGELGQSDLLAINGNLTISSSNTALQLFGIGDAFDGSSYTIMTWTGSRSGWFDSILLDGITVTGNIVDGWDLGNGYSLLVNSNSAVLQIPEPAYAALLFVPAVGLVLLLRRRRMA